MHLALLACIACIGHVTAGTIDTTSAVRCPPIAYDREATLLVMCQDDEDTVSCSRDVSVGTMALMICSKHHYAGREAFTGAECGSDGAWMYQSTCQLPDCGRQNSVNVTVDGEQVQDGEMPWNVNIYNKKSSGLGYRCSGTLISEDRVITSAYCVTGNGNKVIPTSSIVLAAGKLIYNSFDSANVNEQWRNVTSISRHEEYVVGRNATNNIAILVTDGTFTINNFVMPTCIDWSGQLLDPTASDLTIAAAWKKGTTNTSLQLLAPQRYSINLDLATCKASTRSSLRRYITDDKYCAESVGNDSCDDRNAAGMTFQYATPGGDRHYLMGVGRTSLSSTKSGNGCSTNIRSAYTNLAEFIPWIRENMM